MCVKGLDTPNNILLQNSPDCNKAKKAQNTLFPPLPFCPNIGYYYSSTSTENMMYHVPMCVVCGEYEVGSFKGGTDEYCSAVCEAEAHAEMDALRIDADEWEQDGEPEGSHDLSDDADALASAGWGTDEDYGYYGGEDF